MAKKIRLDQLLVQRGLAETRSKAQALIMAGAVRVAGVVGTKAGELVRDDADVEVEAALPYASRGGYKLAHALDTFGLLPAGLAAVDVGASTGGFTDVLLQRGAARVYAVDVGYGLLDWRLRQDPRVVVVERTNIRYLEALPAGDRGWGIGVGESAPTPVLADCATIDVSFISLRLVLPALRRLIQPGAWVVALIKPQFEAGAEQVGKGGVVRDPAVHTAVLREVLAHAATIGLPPHGLARSPITGPAGNVEFLAWLGDAGPELDVERAIKAVVP
ncbi:MAG TPA: TlyA family RNA methyltransferase [Roseiflexaceae bacterium]|nr:TlyA family RNA methyltransferase [Roseiflexaceae bacterium]